MTLGRKKEGKKFVAHKRRGKEWPMCVHQAVECWQAGSRVTQCLLSSCSLLAATHHST